MTYIPENYKPIKLETNGTLNKYPLITLINPQTSQISSTNLTEYKNKKWISSCIFFNELDLSTIVFSDLYGIYGSFVIPSYLPKLTTISFPILNIINGSFILSPNTGATNSVSQLPLLVNILTGIPGTSQDGTMFFAFLTIVRCPSLSKGTNKGVSDSFSCAIKG